VPVRTNVQYTGCLLKHTENIEVVRSNNLSPIAKFQHYDYLARPLVLTAVNPIIQVFTGVEW